MPPPILIGGPGKVLAGTATTTVAWWKWNERSNWFYFENLDPSNDITLYFTTEDKNADRGIVVPAGVGTPGNPLSVPLQASGFWIKSNLSNAEWRLLICVGRG